VENGGLVPSWTGVTPSPYRSYVRRSVVVLELNEVPWEILDDFVTARPTSSLARLLARSHCYTSMAADRGHLSPWTTWPTLHRGVNDEQHMIASFGQDRRRADRRFPPIWSLLHDAGVTVGVCGTLHTYPAPVDLDSYAFYLPDAFATEPVAHPPELVDFQRFNLAMSRESARNVDTHIAMRDAIAVVRHSRRLGIRPTTYAALGKQLLAERRRPAMSNRRRTYQSVLLFDVFARQLKRSRPRFSTFFTNHLASAMHRYWAAHRPGDYEQFGLGPDWVDAFHDEVIWATGQAESMVDHLANHVDASPGSQLWIASSMGQRATLAESLETQLYLTHPDRFLEAMGLPGEDAWQRRPAMLPHFNLVVEPEYVTAFHDALRTVTVGGQPLLFKRADDGSFSIQFGHTNLHDQVDAVAVAGEARPIASLGLETVEIEDRSGTTAYHVPEGILAVYDPARPPVVEGSRPEVSVLEVAPAILRTLGVEPPPYMAQPGMLAGLLPL
jgi:hypothetical protein